jgi:carbonic anhydrase
MTGNQPPVRTPEEALACLKEGNERFTRGEARFPTVQKEVLAELAKGQHPYATILGCSDSRVPPELLFDAGFGELFVIRVAGNVLGAEIYATLQYAGVHLHTPLFVVLGHEACGAVTAAVHTKYHGTRQASRISSLVAGIMPGLDGLDASLPDEALVHAAIEANVRYTVEALTRTPEARARLAGTDMKLVGAVAEIATGRVRFLD